MKTSGRKAARPAGKVLTRLRPEAVHDPWIGSLEVRAGGRTQRAPYGEQSYITDGKAVRVRVWGKADEYPYKCTTLSLSLMVFSVGSMDGSVQSDRVCLFIAIGTLSPSLEVVAMPPPGGCARGGGQWAGTHGPPRSVPARRVEEDNGTQ